MKVIVSPDIQKNIRPISETKSACFSTRIFDDVSTKHILNSNAKNEYLPGVFVVVIFLLIADVNHSDNTIASITLLVNTPNNKPL